MGSPHCRHPLNPQNVYFTLCCLGAALIHQGKYSEAEMFLTQATKLDSMSTLALRHLVDVYDFQSRPEEALSFATRISKMDPADEEIKQKIAAMQSKSPRSSTHVASSAGARDLPEGSSQEIMPPLTTRDHGSNHHVDQGSNSAHVPRGPGSTVSGKAQEVSVPQKENRE